MAGAAEHRFHLAFRTDRALNQVQQQTRRRVLKWFERRAVWPEEATALMLGLVGSRWRVLVER